MKKLEKALPNLDEYLQLELFTSLHFLSKYTLRGEKNFERVFRQLESHKPRFDREDAIRAWKLMEESGELARAVLKDDKREFIDAIGDMVVVLTNLAYLGGTNIEHCIDSAYDVIRKRKGKMVNGTFVKNG